MKNYIIVYCFLSTVALGNEIYIDQQLGSGNNSVNIEQGNVLDTSRQNVIDLVLLGSNNNLILKQGQNNSLDMGGHSQDIHIVGNNNSVINVQNNNGTGGHQLSQNIIGDYNDSTISQYDNNTKSIQSFVNGNHNTQSIIQKDLGEHHLDISLTGNDNSATVIQEGDVANSAIINLENIGGASNLILNQQGATGYLGNVYNVIQQCANPAGCSVSVTQTAH
jgi:hypothetical protein